MHISPSHLSVKELNNNKLKSVNGGGPILEGLAWWSGFVHELYKASHKNQTRKEYMDEARVLVGG